MSTFLLRFYFAVSFLALPFAVFAQDPVLFSRCYGGLSQEDKCWSVIDAPPGVIMSGRTNSTDGDVTGLHGGEDGWVVRTNIFGTIAWSKCYGGTSDENFFRTIRTADGHLLHVGYSEAVNGDVTQNYGMRDFWVVKTDTLGALIWQKSYGGSAEDCAFAALDFNDGTYLIGGVSHSTNGLVTGHHGTTTYRDVWILKVSAQDGHLIWEHSYGGAANEGSTQYVHGFRLFSMVQYDSSSFAFTCTSNSQDGDVQSGDGTNNFWLVKADTSGQILFEKSYGGSYHDFSYNLVKAYDGGFLLVGSSSSNDGDVTGHHGSTMSVYDYWVARTDSSGVLLWQRSCGGNANEDAYGVCATPLGFYIIGRCESSNGDVLGQGYQGSMDSWVCYLDNNGVYRWGRCFGGSAWDQCNDVFVGANGMLTCGGFAASNDGDVFNNHGGYDFWLAKLADVTSVPENSEANGMTLFPNPGGDKIWLSGTAAVHSVEVYDVAGHRVADLIPQNGTLDCSTLARGCYVFILYRDEEIVDRVKWIRQ
jgi:hypothetical protein